ncbi:MAG: LPS assembly lipoprotein LptE [Opitutales bacterium]|nr:LPS assembly lipoprotein LptE [Opitutales bacterium]
MGKIRPSLYFFLVIVFLLNGCRYKSNTFKIGNSRSIYVHAVRNESLAPQLGLFLSKNIRENIVQRGHFVLTSDKSVSALILKVSLDDYRKTPEVYNPNDTFVASGFNLKINAKCSLINNRGKVLLDDVVLTDNVSVLRRSSLTKPSDRQAVQSLAESLGRQINHLIENYSW